jgi:hypothetical protein
MRELATIEKIEKLTDIPDKDRIVLSTVGGWEVIVEKGKYKEGDLVVYCEYDTVLPVRKEFEFLRSRCYSKLYNGFRIRNMKMAGVFSQGIVFPLSILSETTRKKAKEGTNVAKELGIEKYDPEAKKEIKNPQYTGLKKHLMKYKWFRRIVLGKYVKKEAYPATVPKSDEINIQKMFNYLKQNHPNELYYLTEKMEGQAVSYMVVQNGKKREFRVYSHNTMRPNWQKGIGNWERVARDLEIDKLLLSQKDNLCIQGEICGPGIQKNIYGFDELKLFVYGLISTDTGRKITGPYIELFCNDNGLSFVPILDHHRKLPETLKEVLDESNGKSVFGDVKREGIVWRSIVHPDIGFKAKSPEYLMWFDKKDKTE